MLEYGVQGKLTFMPNEVKKEELQEIKKNLQEINRKKDKKTRNSAIMGGIMILALTVVVVLLITNFTDLEEIKQVFLSIGQNHHWVWLFVAFLLLIIFLFLWPLSLIAFSKSNGIDKVVGKRRLFEIATIEQFYNNVTPFAFGGQPMEVYLMKECGADMSKATGSILATFVVHVVASNIYAIIALFFFPFYIKGLSQGGITGLTSWLNPTVFTIIVAIGYFNNILTLVIMLLLGLSKRVRNLLVSLLTKISNWKMFRKFLPSKIEAFENYCDKTQTAFKEIFIHKKAFLLSLLYRMLADLAYYSIPFFLLLAVGVELSNVNPFFVYILVMFGTSFAITAVVWVPTPGTTGGIDYAFAVVLASLSVIGLGGNLFTSETVWATSQTISLLWRGYTYYFVILFGLFVSIALEIELAKKQSQEIKILAKQAEEISHQDNPEL